MTGFLTRLAHPQGETVESNHSNEHQLLAATPRHSWGRYLVVRAEGQRDGSPSTGESNPVYIRRFNATDAGN